MAALLEGLALAARHHLDALPERVQLRQRLLARQHLAHLDAPLRALRQPRRAHRLAHRPPLRHLQQHAQTVERLLDAHRAQLAAPRLAQPRDVLAQRHLHRHLHRARGTHRHLRHELLQVHALAAQHVHDLALAQLRRRVQRAVRVPLGARVQEARAAHQLLHARHRVVHQRVAQRRLAREAVQVRVRAVLQQDARAGRGARLARQHQRRHALRVLHVHQAARRRRRCVRRVGGLAQHGEAGRVSVQHRVHEDGDAA